MIRTTHIRQMLVESLNLAGEVDGREGAESIGSTGGTDHSAAEGLRHAATLARHAAAELDMELDALGGWPG